MNPLSVAIRSRCTAAELADKLLAIANTTRSESLRFAALRLLAEHAWGQPK